MATSQHNERKKKSFIERYGMTPTEWRELKRVDAQKALKLRVEAYKKSLNKK